MQDFEAEINTLEGEMENFLRAVARNEPSPSSPIYLHIDYKNSLKLSDRSKTSYRVEQSFLSAFRDIYTDKSFKAVRLHNWEFELEFEGKKTKRISLWSDSVVFLASKNIKKEITGCHFKVIVADKEEDFNKLSTQLKGYLNRLGKRHLLSFSQNLPKNPIQLSTFIPVSVKKNPTFNYKPYVAPGQQKPDPLTTLSAEGKKVVEKLRHFMTRQQIYDFIVQEEVSEEAASSLRRLAVGK